MKKPVHVSVREVANWDTLMRGIVLEYALESLFISRLDTVAVDVDSLWGVWF